MNPTLLARLGTSARLAGRAVRALLPRGQESVTLPTVTDFQGGGWIAHRRMSPQEVRWTLEQAASGSLQAQWELFAMMEDTWPRLAKNLGELRRAAARATYAVQPYAARGAQPTKAALDRSALVDEAIRQWWPKPGTLELHFEDTLFHALDAYGKGVSVLEVHWHRTTEGILPRCSHVLAPQRYGWNQTGTELGLITAEADRAWTPFPRDHFLVGFSQARTGAPGATAMLRALAPYWAGITFGWEWLLSNAQIFGVPFRWTTYDKSQPALAHTLRDMLAEMGASGYGAFPEGTKLEFKEAAQNVTGNPQVVVQEMANSACDLLILGQELSGAAQAAGIGGGAAALQSTVRADRLQAAAQWCADMLNYQLVPAVLRANWGDTAEPPTIVADIDDEPDPLKLANRDQVLLNAGIDLPRSWFYERHGIPMPVAGEETITGRAPAPPDFRPSALPPRSLQAKAVQPGALARLAAFRSTALERLSDAQRASLAPLVTRIEAIVQLPDEDFSAGLKAIARDLPQLYRTVLSDPQVAAAWEDIYSAALISGAAESAAQTSAST